MLGQHVGARARAPLGGNGGDIRTEDRGDVREAVPEGADVHRQHPVAGRERVHHRRLEGAGSRSGQEQRALGSTDQLADARRDLAEHLAELAAAVVDHLLRLRLADGGRDGDRAGCPQILIHGRHHNRRMEQTDAPAPAD